MDTKSRIKSIVESAVLDSSITGLHTFDLSVLQYDTSSAPEFRTNVRLGHLAEEVIKHCINTSEKFNILHHNIQLIEEKTTIGELDFILQENASKTIVHMEMAYKFYLFDPTLSDEIVGNWIGPNRNDSLSKKLEKLKEKQFPLLYHPGLKSMLPDVEIDKASQSLCLLASLYVPIELTRLFDSSYQKAVRGYYLNYQSFKLQNHQNKHYCTPERKQWGINPQDNTDWKTFEEIIDYITVSIEEKQSVLMWSRKGDQFSEFFVTWW